MIVIKNLTKSYQLADKTHVVLDKINLTIAKGELIAIVGASGSGKSTLLNIIGMLDTFNKGRYCLNNKDMNEANSDELAFIRNHYIGFVFQQFNLLPRLSAELNVELPLTYNKNISSVDAKKLAIQALKRVSMDKFSQYKPTELSGGQQQRVAIARALVNNPQIILADEPTGALDSKTGKEIMQLFLSLHQEGKTIVLVTHDKSIASLCKRKIIIEDGKILTTKEALHEV